MKMGDRVRVNATFHAPPQYIGAEATVTAIAPHDKNRSVQTPYVVIRYDSDLLGLFGRGILLETELDLL